MTCNPKRKPRQIAQEQQSLLGYLADDLLPIVPDDIEWEDYCEALLAEDGSPYPE